MRKVSPRTPVARHVHDRVEDGAFRIPWRPPELWLLWKQSADDIPFWVGQFAWIGFLFCHP